MVNEGVTGSVLIVATDRDARRILFDALDDQEFDAISTAKDIGEVSIDKGHTACNVPLATEYIEKNQTAAKGRH